MKAEKKIYNSSGVEVKRPIMGVCPTCGFYKCSGFQHCLRCGQPLRFESYAWDKEHYREQYKNLEEELNTINSMALFERRKEILDRINITEFDVKELYKGRLVKIRENGEHELIYEGINLGDYDIEL